MRTYKNIQLPKCNARSQRVLVLVPESKDRHYVRGVKLKERITAKAGNGKSGSFFGGGATSWKTTAMSR